MISSIIQFLYTVCLSIVVCDLVFFFFKQKTAYEMLRSLVGSEMCIRDSDAGDREVPGPQALQIGAELDLKELRDDDREPEGLSLIHI